MIDLKKHLKMNSGFVLIAASCTMLLSCTEQTKDTEYVARVNESYLTASELEKLADGYSSPGYSRSEIIDHWIRQEILYQEAVKKGIVNNEDFKMIIRNSEKELAAAMLIKQNYTGKNVKINQADLENYFDSKKEEFRLTSNSFILNILKSSNNSFAVDFRSRVLEKGWHKAVEELKNDSSIVDLQENIFVKEENLYPQKLARTVKGLNPLEISIVISDETEYHSVVQVLNVLNEGSIAPFEFVKSDIEKRLIAESEKDFINDYVKELYSKYNIESDD